MTCISHNEINSCNDTFSTLGTSPITFVAQKIESDFQFRGIQGSNVTITENPDIVTIDGNPPLAPIALPNIGAYILLNDPPGTSTTEVSYDFSLSPSFTYNNGGLIVGNEIVVTTPGYYKIYGTISTNFFGRPGAYAATRIRNSANDIIFEGFNATNEGVGNETQMAYCITPYLPIDNYRVTVQLVSAIPFSYSGQPSNFVIQLIAL